MKFNNKYYISFLGTQFWKQNKICRDKIFEKIKVIRFNKLFLGRCIKIASMQQKRGREGGDLLPARASCTVQL